MANIGTPHRTPASVVHPLAVRREPIVEYFESHLGIRFRRGGGGRNQELIRVLTISSAAIQNDGGHEKSQHRAHQHKSTNTHHAARTRTGRKP